MCRKCPLTQETVVLRNNAGNGSSCGAKLMMDGMEEERDTPGRTIVYCRTLHLRVYMKYGLVGRKRQQQSGIGSRALSLRSNALSAVCDEAVEATN